MVLTVVHAKKEGDFVKKIVAAWIEQILEFDGKLEYILTIQEQFNDQLEGD
jgi:hypothetical protein